MYLPHILFEMAKYIYQYPSWPNFSWNDKGIQVSLGKVRYYEILQRSQHSDGEITEWLDWFLNCLYRALEASQELIQKVLHKSMFWDNHKETDFNARQRLMLNKHLDGIDGKLKSSKWAKMSSTPAFGKRALLLWARIRTLHQ